MRAAAPWPRCGGVFALLASGCAFSLPAKTSGPASAEDVSASLVGQRCAYSAGDDQAAGSRHAFGIDLEVEIDNQTASALAFRPEDAVLVAATGLRMTAEPSSPAVQVPSGEKRRVVFGFSAEASPITCYDELDLDLQNSLIPTSGPAAVPPIRFVPFSAWGIRGKTFAERGP